MSNEEIAELIMHEEGIYKLLRYFKYANHRFVCPSCGGERESPQNESNLTKCAECGRIESFTANTIFHGHRKPIVKLMAICLDVALNNGTSAAELARRHGMVYSTVWEWQQKARELIAAFFLTGKTQSVHHTHLISVLFRRSSESEPKTQDCVSSTDLANLGKLVTQRLQSKKAKELFEKKVPEPQDQKAVSIAIQYFSNLFHSGFSHKHARGYAAQFCFVVNFAGQVQQLLAACVRARPIRGEIATSPEYLTLPIFV